MTSDGPNSIARIRKGRGLSQQALADAVGSHWVTISKLERGRIKLTYEWAVKLARALNTEVWQIFPDNDFLVKDLELRGVIGSNGRVHEQLGRAIAMDLDYFANDEDEWYEIGNEDFYPTIHQSDIVRLSPVDVTHVQHYFGRLCMVRDLGDEQKPKFGVLARNEDGRILIQRANGAVIQTGELHVVACVTMIILGAGVLDLGRRSAKRWKLGE